MTDVELVLACYDAYAPGDIQAAVSSLHEDIEWIELNEFPNGGPRHG